MSGKKFHAKSTAMEVIEGHDLSEYEIILTGGSSGIVVETLKGINVITQKKRETTKKNSFTTKQIKDQIFL